MNDVNVPPIEANIDYENLEANRLQRGLWVPGGIAGEAELKAEEVLILSDILFFKVGGYWKNNKSLAQIGHTSEGTVKRILNRLEKMELIVRAEYFIRNNGQAKKRRYIIPTQKLLALASGATTLFDDTCKNNDEIVEGEEAQTGAQNEPTPGSKWTDPRLKMSRPPAQNEPQRILHREYYIENTKESVERAPENHTEEEGKAVNPPGLPFVKITPIMAVRKTRKRKPFVPPTLDEVKAHFRARGYICDPEEFFRAGNDGGWTRSDGSPVVSWKLWAAQWENTERKKRKRQRGYEPQAVSTAPPGFWENFNDIMAEKRRKLLEEVERKEREAANNGQSGNDSADVDARN